MKPGNRQNREVRGPWDRLAGSPLVHGIALAILGGIIYSNTLDAPFLFDDEPNIIHNPVIRRLGNFLASPKGFGYYPVRIVGYLTFAVNYRFGGLEVTGYHVVNIAIHIANALLVYAFVRLTFRAPLLRDSSISRSSPSIALMAAALFLAHPVQTEAVTYITQRFTSLAAMFYLIAFCLYAGARLGQESGNPSTRKTLLLYLLSCLAAVLAMRTKEIAFTLPIMLTLYEFIFFRTSSRRRIAVLLPMLLTLAIIPISLFDSSRMTGDILSDLNSMTRVQSEEPRLDYLTTQFRVVTTYVRLLGLPVSQNIDYDYPTYRSLLGPGVFLSFLFLLSLLAAAVLLLVKARGGREGGARLASFGILWFFIALAVESGVVPIADVIAERRVYLPSIGAFTAVTTGCALALGRHRGPGVRVGAAVVGALVLLLLSAATYERNSLWQDEVRLWDDAVRKSPMKARARYNYGNSLHKRGRIDEAMEQYEAAIRLRPDYFQAHNNLGDAYHAKGLLRQAAEEYGRAIRYAPDHVDIHNNLAIVHLEMGSIDKAIEQYRIALGVDPNFAGTYHNLGFAYMKKGLVDKAIDCYVTAINLRPDFVAAYLNLAAAYEMAGLHDKAAAIRLAARDLERVKR